MRRIVATVAFGGREYLSHAEVMFKSLALQGSTAERVCVSDQAHVFPDHLGVQVVVVEPSASVKAGAALALNLSGDDELMLVDSDQLFIRNPDFLFSLVGNGVMVATTGIPLKTFTFSTQYLAEVEIAKVPLSRPCINTGLMLFSGHAGFAFARRWAAYHAEVRGELETTTYNILKDQPALEALLWRGVIAADYLPSKYMHFPLGTTLPPDPDCVLLHFTGFTHNESGKVRLGAAMKKRLEEMRA